MLLHLFDERNPILKNLPLFLVELLKALLLLLGTHFLKQLLVKLFQLHDWLAIISVGKGARRSGCLQFHASLFTNEKVVIKLLQPLFLPFSLACSILLALIEFQGLLILAGYFCFKPEFPF